MSKKKEVTSLVLLLTSSVIAALVIVGLMIYNWGPSGRYTLDKVLLAPEMFGEISYQEIEGDQGGGPYMVFHGVEYLHPGQNGTSWRHNPVTPEKYTAFYNVIRGEQSIREDSTTAEEAFHDAGIASLQLRVRPRSNGESRSRIFQELQFSPNGEYYRVGLKLDAPEPWAYFYHPGIREKADAILLRGV